MAGDLAGLTNGEKCFLRTAAQQKRSIEDSDHYYCANKLLMPA